MSGGRDWTTGEVRRLRQMRSERAHTKDIATVLGRTENAIYSFLRDDHEKPTKRINEWSAEELDTLQRLAAEGATMLEAAEILKRTPNAVKSAARRESIRFRHNVHMLERESNKYRRDAVEGSRALLDALLRCA